MYLIFHNVLNVQNVKKECNRHKSELYRTTGKALIPQISCRQKTIDYTNFKSRIIILCTVGDIITEI